MAAFGEEEKTPTIPAPLIRVRVGTPIHAIIRHPLDDTLVVRGLSERGGIQDSLIIAPGTVGDAIFAARRVGTCQYWGALNSWQRRVPLPPAVRQGGRYRPRFDSQLAGAVIVDPVGPVPDDRIFVITETVDQAPPIRTERHGIPGREFTALNGKSWPYTELASGETADFEFTPDRPAELRLDAGVPGRGGSGASDFQVQASAPLHVVVP